MSHRIARKKRFALTSVSLLATLTLLVTACSSGTTPDTDEATSPAPGAGSTGTAGPIADPDETESASPDITAEPVSVDFVGQQPRTFTLPEFELAATQSDLGVAYELAITPDGTGYLLTQSATGFIVGVWSPHTQTWEVINSADADLHAPQALAADGAGRVYLADAGDGSLYVGEPNQEGDMDWGEVSPSDELPLSLAPDPVDAAGMWVLNADSDSLESFTLAYTDDGGSSWNQSDPLPLAGLTPAGLAVTPAGTLFIPDFLTNELHASNDGGRTWETLPAFANLANRPTAITADAVGTLYVSTLDSGLLRSQDNGASWLRYPETGSILTTSVDHEGRVYLLDGENHGYQLNTVPSAPTQAVVERHGADLTVTWEEPALTGGSAITGYRIIFNTDLDIDTAAEGDELAEDSGPLFADQQVLSPQEHSYTFHNVPEEGTVTVQLTALNDQGDSAPISLIEEATPVTPQARTHTQPSSVTQEPVMAPMAQSAPQQTETSGPQALASCPGIDTTTSCLRFHFDKSGHTLQVGGKWLGYWEVTARETNKKLVQNNGDEWRLSAVTDKPGVFRIMDIGFKARCLDRRVSAGVNTLITWGCNDKSEKQEWYFQVHPKDLEQKRPRYYIRHVEDSAKNLCLGFDFKKDRTPGSYKAQRFNCKTGGENILFKAQNDWVGQFVQEQSRQYAFYRCNQEPSWCHIVPTLNSKNKDQKRGLVGYQCVARPIVNNGSQPVTKTFTRSKSTSQTHNWNVGVSVTVNLGLLPAKLFRAALGFTAGYGGSWTRSDDESESVQHSISPNSFGWETLAEVSVPVAATFQFDRKGPDAIPWIIQGTGTMPVSHTADDSPPRQDTIYAYNEAATQSGFVPDCTMMAAPAIRKNGQPTISNENEKTLKDIRVGHELKAAPGDWSVSGPGWEYAYQWLRDGDPIADATEDTYVVQISDVGAELAVSVYAQHRNYYPGVANSQNTSAVKPTSGNGPTTPPTVGPVDPDLSDELELDPGTWEEGWDLAVQWYRGNEPLAGETSMLLELTDDDAGQRIFAKVTGSKKGFEPFTASSNTVIPRNKENTSVGLKLSSSVHTPAKRAALSISAVTPDNKRVAGLATITAGGTELGTVKLTQEPAQPFVLPADLPLGSVAVQVSFEPDQPKKYLPGTQTITVQVQQDKPAPKPTTTPTPSKTPTAKPAPKPSKTPTKKPTKSPSKKPSKTPSPKATKKKS